MSTGTTRDTFIAVSQHSSTHAGHRDDDDHQTHPVCAPCANVIGVYEPIWMKLTDISLRQSSLLNLAKGTPPGQSITGIWHAGCLATSHISLGVMPTSTVRA